MIRLRPSGADEVLIKRVRDWYEPGPGVFIAPQALFNPALLFTTGVNGTWYDPSDLNTLFQDAAGTTPVTAVEQPVGLMLDKSKGLVLGPELVTNGDGSSAVGWSGSTGGTPSASDGKLVLTASAGTSYPSISQTISVVSGKTYLVTVTGFIGTSGNLPAINLLSGFSPAINTLITPGIQSKYILTATGSTATLILFAWPEPASAGTTLFDNISVRELPGNHAFNPSGNSANFPVLKQDEAGRKYLNFNGTNQWLQTNSIDFSYGDKMFMCAGVRKASDGLGGMIIELSSSTPSTDGTACLVPGDVSTGSGPRYSFGSRGTVFAPAESAASYAAPITNVLSGIGNISGDQAILRINGTQAAINTADQGTGNYGNYPLYIGTRAGTPLWFNGRLHQLIVAGKQASDSEIGQTEAFVNQKTGAY